MTFTKIKCMIRMMYAAITKRGGLGVRYGNTNFSSPLLESTSNATGSNSNYSGLILNCNLIFDAFDFM